MAGGGAGVTLGAEVTVVQNHGRGPMIVGAGGSGGAGPNRLLDEYAEALQDLEGFSALILLYVFDSSPGTPYALGLAWIISYEARLLSGIPLGPTRLGSRR